MPKPRYLPLLAACLLLVATAATATDLVRPVPSLEPEAVVRLQLEALQRNDSPYPDAGIEQTWLLAHPANRAFTGPLPRFAGMLHGPLYRTMLNHRSHGVDAIDRGDGSVTFMVTIRSADNEALAFEWTVERVAEGEFEGCWMTTAVSQPMPLGQVI